MPLSSQSNYRFTVIVGIIDVEFKIWLQSIDKFNAKEYVTKMHLRGLARTAAKIH